MMLESPNETNLPSLVVKLENAVRRGGSLDTVCALHIAAATERLGSPIIRFLVRLGASIDGLDKERQTPLHVAAYFHCTSTVETLLDLGADPSRRTASGRTPLDCSASLAKSTEDLAASFGYSPRFQPGQVRKRWQTIRLLLPPEHKAQLKDGWMSPRMHHRLESSVRLFLDSVLRDGAGLLRDAMNNYMPASVVQSVSGPAFLGTVVVLNAILTRLEADQTPCTNKVEETIYGMPAIPLYLAFVENGGNVEHMLDCLIKWAKDDSETSTSIEDETPADCPDIPILDKDFDLVRLMCLHGSIGGSS